VRFSTSFLIAFVTPSGGRAVVEDTTSFFCFFSRAFHSSSLRVLERGRVEWWYGWDFVVVGMCERRLLMITQNSVETVKLRMMKG
jgi:hypothetical protein